jgi:hypothetical protein
LIQVFKKVIKHSRKLMVSRRYSYEKHLSTFQKYYTYRILAIMLVEKSTLL